MKALSAKAAFSDKAKRLFETAPKADIRRMVSDLVTKDRPSSKVGRFTISTEKTSSASKAKA